MAKIYADQGNFEKAAEIYRYLIELEPDRQDLIDALSEVEKIIFEKDPESLVKLLNKWVDLLLKHYGLHKLKKLQNYLGER
jgi:tetratricopeptide (TPR) repeat protein